MGCGTSFVKYVLFFFNLVVADLQSKTPRKRVANFTADEKALLAQLIKKRPIVESKVTDGKSVAKKQEAWESITQEFNCHANVHKRETATLKRAWDNMKAFTRKARATERGNLFRTGGGPHAPPPPPQHGALISMVEEAAPMMINEIKNTFDNDGAILDGIDNSQDLDCLAENANKEIIISSSIDTLDNLEIQENGMTNSPVHTETPKCTDYTTKNLNYSADIKNPYQVRRPSDYIRREAVMRIRNLENKKKNEMQLFKIQLLGLALIGIGIAFHLNWAVVKDELKTHLTVAPWVFIIIGAVMFVIAFFGCCGAIRESHCMVVTYAIFLLVIIIVQVVIAVLLFAYGNTIRESLVSSVRTVFEKRSSANVDKATEALVNSIQQQFECCGDRGPQYYGPTAALSLPDSCCTTTGPIGSIIGGKCTLEAANYGCEKKISDLYDKWDKPIAGAAIGVACVEVIGALFALCLANSIRNMDRRSRY